VHREGVTRCDGVVCRRLQAQKQAQQAEEFEALLESGANPYEVYRWVAGAGWTGAGWQAGSRRTSCSCALSLPVTLSMSSMAPVYFFVAHLKCMSSLTGLQTLARLRIDV